MILGMAYKPGTTVTEASQGMELLKGLKGVRSCWYDPLVKGTLPLEAVPGAIAKANVVVIMQPCPEFKEFDYGDTPVLDCWRLLRDCPPENWHPMGIGARDG